MYHAELVVEDGVTLIKDGMILLPNEIDWGSITPTEIKLGSWRTRKIHRFFEVYV